MAESRPSRSTERHRTVTKPPTIPVFFCAEHHQECDNVTDFVLVSFDADPRRGGARGHRGVTTHGEWRQHMVARSARGSDSVRHQDRRRLEMAVARHCEFSGSVPSSLGNRPSSLRHLSLETVDPLRCVTGLRTRAGEISDRLQVPSGGLGFGTL